MDWSAVASVDEKEMLSFPVASGKPVATGSFWLDKVGPIHPSLCPSKDKPVELLTMRKGQWQQQQQQQLEQRQSGGKAKWSAIIGVTRRRQRGQKRPAKSSFSFVLSFPLKCLTGRQAVPSCWPRLLFLVTLVGDCTLQWSAEAQSFYRAESREREGEPARSHDLRQLTDQFIDPTWLTDEILTTHTTV